MKITKRWQMTMMCILEVGLTAVIISACQQPRTTGYLIFSNPDCSLPCLDGIIPGSTTASETSRILNEQGHVDSISSTSVPRLSRASIDWEGLSFLGNYGAAAIYDPESEEQVILEIGFSLPQITLGFLIDELGPPTHVSSFTNTDDIVGWGVLVTWRNINFVATARAEGQPFPDINGEMIFTQGYFYDNESTLEISYIDDYFTHQFEWDGFGAFEKYLE